MRHTGHRAKRTITLLAAILACVATAMAYSTEPPLLVAQVPTPPGTAVTEPSPSVAANEEEQQTMALLVDLQRYSAESNEDLRRELAAAIQALNRARTEPNRIRAAILLTLPGAGAPDDARAITLLESVSGRTPGASPLKQLAVVLQTQISERVRGMTEERKKSAAAQEKLDQLRAVERSLLLERNRNAGGAGGGGGGGGTGR